MTQAVAEQALDQTLRSEDELFECGEAALKIAREQGASSAAVNLGTQIGLSTSLRNGALESVEFHQDNDLGVTVYFGRQRGQASTGDLRASSIREAVEAACEIARNTQDDPAAGLPDAQELADQPLELDLDHPASLTPGRLQDLARECEEAAFAVDARIQNSEGASTNVHRGRDVLMNSLGFRGARTSTDYSVSVAVIAKDGDDMQRDYWYRRGLDADVFTQASAVGRRAAQRTVRRLQARKISTRRAPVVFPPELARGLIGHLLGAASGGSLYRRSSFLLDKMDQLVLPQGVSILQRPHQPGRQGAAWFDAEGVATRDLDIVTDGRLGSWLLSSYSARKLDSRSTGNAGGPQTIEVSPTRDAGLDALLQEAGTGLLVTELMGQGVSLNTGDYSRGAAGIWFENGKPAYPVAEITIAGNLLDMYRAVAAIGNDIDPAATIRCGAILLEEMTIAGS